MTTTASAHNITADLRRDLTAKAEALRAAIAAGPAQDTRVLYADCGMVVGTTADGETFRLTGTGDALGEAFRFTSETTANRTRDLWNGALTREQMTARCWVQALPLAQAMERAADEAEALLDAIAKV